MGENERVPVFDSLFYAERCETSASLGLGSGGCDTPMMSCLSWLKTKSVTGNITQF